MTKITKARLHEDTRINFYSSSEITYWAKKLKVNAEVLQKKFEQLGYSMQKTILYFTKQIENEVQESA